MLSENTDRRILLAPLDWGLGHTTRIVPIIRQLCATGFTPIVACNQSQASFLKGIFPELLTAHLEGYGITYAHIDYLNKGTILSQIPKALRSITREHAWLMQHLAELNPLAIISDNRYGLYHPDIPSVIISHQPGLQTGMGAAIDSWVQRWHYKFIDKFSAIWIPDSQGTAALAGKLSNPIVMPNIVHQYIGPLSQFVDLPIITTEQQYLLLLLSGPEPQRTKLERLLLNQCVGLPQKIVMVGGTQQPNTTTSIASNITYISRTSGQDLANLIAGAAVVVCRAGYSTIMDLVYLGKSALLIPTPGQPEQEYLARHLNDKMGFSSVRQQELELRNNLLQLPPNDHSAATLDFKAHQPVLDQFLNAL